MSEDTGVIVFVLITLPIAIFTMWLSHWLVDGPYAHHQDDVGGLMWAAGIFWPIGLPLVVLALLIRWRKKQYPFDIVEIP